MGINKQTPIAGEGTNPGNVANQSAKATGLGRTTPSGAVNTGGEIKDGADLGRSNTVYDTNRTVTDNTDTYYADELGNNSGGSGGGGSEGSQSEASGKFIMPWWGVGILILFGLSYLVPMVARRRRKRGRR